MLPAVLHKCRTFCVREKNKFAIFHDKMFSIFGIRKKGSNQGMQNLRANKALHVVVEVYRRFRGICCLLYVGKT
jgi:hypothetical protein